MAFSRSVGEGDISGSVAQVVDRYVTPSWQPAARAAAARRPPIGALAPKRDGEGLDESDRRA